MIITLTGTRNGLTTPQALGVAGAIATRIGHRSANPHLPLATILHGDCVGVDAEVHQWLRAMYGHIRIESYRVGSGNLVANCDADVVHDRTGTGHLARNREMVDRSSFVVGAPPCAEPQPRGGTWYTIKYAWQQGKDTMVIAPDGSIVGGWRVDR